MRVIRLILSVTLATFDLVGIQILSTDYWLWSAAPTHAYGLIVFVALDVALMFGAWIATRLVFFGAFLTATVQVLAMFGDIIAGEPTGLSASVFRSYLLADTSYLALFIIQGLIMGIALGTWALPHLHGHWLASLRISRR